MLIHHLTTLVADLTGGESTHSSNSAAWDVLYVAAGMIVFCLLVAALAETLLVREHRKGGGGG